MFFCSGSGVSSSSLTAASNLEPLRGQRANSPRHNNVERNSLLCCGWYPVGPRKFPDSISTEYVQNRLYSGGFSLRAALWAPKMVNFPVEFPVSREIARRQVRSPLRRQPAIPAFGDSLQAAPHRPRNPGFSRVRLGLQASGLSISGAK
jgi:hypothetical protein